MCLPAVSFIIVIISSFVSLENAIWVPSTWSSHSKSARRSRRAQAQAAFSSPGQTHSLFQSHMSLHSPGNTIGLWYYSSYRFACARIHMFKLSGLLLVTWKSEVSHEKKVWFRIPAPYILKPNLALKSPEDDHILLLPPIEKYFRTSRDNLS